MNINSFISTVNASEGLARQNRYSVIIPTVDIANRSKEIYEKQVSGNSALQFPEEATDWIADWLSSDMKDLGNELTAFCEQTQLPSYQFAVTENRFYGPSFKVPHKPEYQDITMTFLCGNTMLERYFFESWMYMIMDPVTNNFNYIGEYAVNIDIVQHKEQIVDEMMTFNYATTLIDAYPIAVNTQELGYDMNNSYQKLQVTFTYKRAVPFIGVGSGSTVNMPRRGQQGTFNQTVDQIPPKTQTAPPAPAAPTQTSTTPPAKSPFAGGDSGGGGASGSWA